MGSALRIARRAIALRWTSVGLLVASMVAAPLAQGVLIDFGTTEGITFRTCIAGVSGCDSVSSPVALVGGSPGAPSSAASFTLPGFGTATGSVSLSGEIGAPILTASATSAPGTRQNTNSFALQRYTYTGASPTTRTFGGVLTYSQSVTGVYPPEIGNGINAAIDVFSLPGSKVDVGATPESNFNALSDPFAFPGYVDLGLDHYTDAPSTTAGTATLGVSVTLNPGDSVWVWALLQTPATNGGTVDAAHTFVTAWNDTSDLLPAIVAPAPVPEPTTVLLLALGFAELSVARIRSRGRS